MAKRILVMLLVAAVGVLVAVPAFADAPANFKAKCAMCHGADGAGQTTMGKSLKLRDLRTDEVQKQSTEDIEKIISAGKGKMPAYKGKLPEADIDALSKFVKDMGKKK